MPFCRICGAQIPPDSRFCPHCGTTIAPVQGQPYAPSPCQPSSSTTIVLGTLGIVCAWLLAIAGHALSIIGIVLGVKEYRLTGRMTGLVLSIVGEVCSVISSLLGMMIMAGAF